MSDTATADAVDRPINDNPFDFDAQEAADLTPKEIRGIKWKGRNYVLKEATEDAHIKFTNARIRAARMEDGKLTALAGGAEVEALLVSLCLFEIGERPDGSEVLKPVAEQTIRSQWPPRYIRKLFEEAKRISDIDQPDKKTLDQRIADKEKELEKLRAEKAAAGNDVGNS